jgi:hypothetical protein
MKRLLAATAFALLGFATATDASLLHISFARCGGANTPPAVPPKDTLITNFSTGSGLSGSGYVLTTGNNPGTDAAPYFGPTVGADPNQLHAVERGGSATLVVPKEQKIQIYVGTVDPYNTISFSNGLSYTGSDLASLTDAVTFAPHDKTNCAGNGLFYFAFSANEAITSVTFSSNKNSFEVAQVSGSYQAAQFSSAVPEPSTWVIMTLGFASLGYAGYRRTKGALAALAAA